MEHRPREIFERLFGDGGTDPEARKNRIRRQKSILDFVKEDVDRVRTQLGHVDSLKLDEFSDALRDVESRVQKAEAKVDMELPEVERPVGIPEHEEHIRLMYDLLLLAFLERRPRTRRCLPGAARPQYRAPNPEPALGLGHR